MFVVYIVYTTLSIKTQESISTNQLNSKLLVTDHHYHCNINSTTNDERPTSGAASTLDPLPLKADRDQLPGGGQGHVGQVGRGQAQWGSCFCFRMQVDVDGGSKYYDKKVFFIFSYSLIAAGQHAQFL